MILTIPMKIPLRYGGGANFLKSLITSPPLLFFALFFFLQAIDISKDYATVFGIPLRDWAPGWNAALSPLHSYAMGLFLILTLGISFIHKIRIPKQVGRFLLILSVFIALGLIVGLLNGNEQKLVWLEASNWIIYIVLPLFVSLLTRNTQSYKTILAVLFLYSLIIMVKIFGAFLIDYAINLSYLRIMVRGNLFLMPLFFVALSLTMAAPKTSYRLTLALAFIALILTGMKGYYIGTAAGLSYLLILKKRVPYGRILRMAILLVLCVTGLSLITGVSIYNLAGLWGDTLQKGTSFRMEQAQYLLSAFKESPLWGKGFGFVLYDFTGFEETLTKPYLQELEWINFLAKTGLIGIVALLSAFICLLKWIQRTSFNALSLKESAILQGLACGLVALLVASFTNTLISSILFHMYIFAATGITAAIAAESRRPLSSHSEKLSPIRRRAAATPRSP